MSITLKYSQSLSKESTQGIQATRLKDQRGPKIGKDLVTKRLRTRENSLINCNTEGRMTKLRVRREPTNSKKSPDIAQLPPEILQDVYQAFGHFYRGKYQEATIFPIK